MLFTVVSSLGVLRMCGQGLVKAEVVRAVTLRNSGLVHISDITWCLLFVVWLVGLYSLLRNRWETLSMSSKIQLVIYPSYL